jgi:hypothetical protein
MIISDRLRAVREAKNLSQGERFRHSTHGKSQKGFVPITGKEIS